MLPLATSWTQRSVEEQQALWQRLQQFEFDRQPAVLTFSARLGREQGWSPEFTRRVLAEYRRFLFLCAIAGHPVCPSEAVDAAWHQHLIYSRSYWLDLCEDTLRFPLHHVPTTGGPDESRKHHQMYQQSLASYRRVFDEEPPADIWPAAEVRFGHHPPRHVISSQNYWRIPKPVWWQRLCQEQRYLAAAALPLLAAGISPLNWSGPQFLLLFATLYVIFLVFSLLYRNYQRDVPEVLERSLTPDEVACLSLGRAGTVNAAVAGMLSQQELITAPRRGLLGGIVRSGLVKFGPGATRPDASRRLERAIYQAVDRQPQTLAEIQQTVAVETQAIADRLMDDGYLVNRERAWAGRWIPAMAFLALLGFGFIKLLVGISRGKDVGFLVIALFIIFTTTLCFLARIQRSMAGDQKLERLKKQHTELKASISSGDATREQVMLGAALFGSAVLVGPLYQDLRAAWRQTAQGGSDWSGVSGCGGSGCGGGCGGCGGD